MALPSFFKQNKPRGFNYSPRHYDPVREEREARHRAMGLIKDQEEGVSSEEGGVRHEESGNKIAGQKKYRRTITKGSMRDIYRHGRKTQQNSSVRLIIIVLILVLVTYLYLRF